MKIKTTYHNKAVDDAMMMTRLNYDLTYLRMIQKKKKVGSNDSSSSTNTFDLSRKEPGGLHIHPKNEQKERLDTQNLNTFF